MPYAEDLPRRLPPPWRDSVGAAFGRAVGTRLDSVADLFRQAAFARFPGLAAEDALRYIGRDRQIPRGPTETAAAYAARLQDAWNLWQGDNTPFVGKGGGGGSHLGVLNAIKAAGLPTGPTGATIVTHGGRYSQLDGSGNLVFGSGMVAVNRQDLTGAVPGTLVGFTMDWRDQFYSKFAVVFPVDVATLREGTEDHYRLNAAVDKWRQSKDYYVGGFVIEAGGGWDWPTTQTWDDGTNWDSDTVHVIPPPF